MPCSPLLEAANKDLFLSNAFRITGLTVEATAREIAKHADKLRVMEELGRGATAHTGAFALKPPPTLEQIRDAAQKLRDPTRRLIDELFWFWPHQFGQTTPDPAIRALTEGDSGAALAIWAGNEGDPEKGPIATHNIAVLWQLTALEREAHSGQPGSDTTLLAQLEKHWRTALKRWNYLLDDDLFWQKVVDRARQIDPDRLTSGFVRRMQATLPLALGKINAELAVAYLESSNPDLAQLHVRLMHQANRDPESVERAAELVLTPSRNRLKEQLRRAKECTNTSPEDAPTAGRQLLDQATQTMAAFDTLLGKQHTSRNELADELANACDRLVLAYHKETQDSATSRELLREALSFAPSAELNHLLTNHAQWFTVSVIGKSKDHPRVRLNRLIAEAIPTPPTSAGQGSGNGDTSLFDHAANVLRAISIDAWKEYRDVATAIAAIDLAIKYACQTDLKQRLLSDRATLKRNIDDAPPETAYSNLKRTIEDATPGSAYRILKAIENSTSSPKAKLERVRMGLIPELEVLRNRHSIRSPTVRGLSDSIAALLRTISIDAYPNHQDLATAMDAIDSARALCFDPDLKSRIEQRFAAVREALAKAQPPQETPAKSTRNVPAIVALVIVGIVILIGVIGSCDTTTTSPTRNTYTAPSTPAYTPPPDPAPPVSTPVAFPSTPPVSGNQRYRVSRSVSQELDSLDQQITAAKTKSRQLENNLATAKEALEAQREIVADQQSRLETLGRRIELDRIYLDRSSQFSVDTFNENVSTYNTLLRKNRTEVAAENELVDSYNSTLEQLKAQNRVVNSLVDDYNQKLRTNSR